MLHVNFGDREYFVASELEGGTTLRQKKLSRKKAYKLIREIRSKTDQIDLLQYVDDIDGDFSEEEKYELDLAGISNGFLSELICTLTGYKVEVYGEVEKLYPCPCCGYRTLTERYDSKEGTGYDICPYCNWEDDGTVVIDVARSINKGSILDYRERLRRETNKYYIEKWLK